MQLILHSTRRTPESTRRRELGGVGRRRQKRKPWYYVMFAAGFVSHSGPTYSRLLLIKRETERGLPRCKVLLSTKRVEKSCHALLSTTPMSGLRCAGTGVRRGFGRQRGHKKKDVTGWCREQKSWIATRERSLWGQTAVLVRVEAFEGSNPI